MASSEDDKPSLEPAQDSSEPNGAHGDPGQTSLDKVRPQKRAFVPNYEPIQTRKRARVSHSDDAPPSLSPPPVASPSVRRDTGRKTNRIRLTRDEVFTPDEGPRPRAVPKSLLILEPEFLPRHLKKRQLKMQTSPGNIQIHTSALVSGKSPTVAWTSPDQLHSVVAESAADPWQTQADQHHLLSAVNTSACGGSATPLTVSFPVLAESSLSSEMETVSEVGGVAAVTGTQSGNGPTSYILTTTAADDDEGTGDFITVSEGRISADTEDGGQSVTYTIISEATGQEEEGRSQGEGERSDTPTSLLLLAEAAYPTSSTVGVAAGQSVVTTLAHPPHSKASFTSDAQSPAKTSATVPESRAGHVGSTLTDSIVVAATSSPTFMTVSCQGGGSTILATSTQGQGQTPSPGGRGQTPRGQGHAPILKGHGQIPAPKGQSQTTSPRGQGQTPLKIQTVPLNPPSGGVMWTCVVCGEVMVEGERERHMTQHLDRVEEGEGEEEDFVCETCGEQLKDEEDLELHMAVEHDEEEEDGGEEEDEGDMGGMEEEGFGDHGEESTSEKTTTVTVTERATAATSAPAETAVETMPAIAAAPGLTSGQAALTTSGSNAGNPVYSCQQCGETFQYAAYLRRHLKTEHADSGAIYTCSVCPRSFTSESALEMHSCLHQKPGISFKCIRCSQCFSSVSLLSSHARSCLRVAIHTPCILPKRSSSGHRGRGGRGRGQSRSRAGDHGCSVCDKTFTSEVYLKAHQLSHQTGTATGNSVQKNRGLQCLYCEDRFHHLGPLKEHMLACHPNAFPFKCTICQRGFSRDSSRIAHEQTHQTLKLHFCRECGEGFTLQTYLNRHKKYRHLKPVKYPCLMCQKEFVRQADRIKHMRVHTGEKPYVCEQCGHGFSQQSNYRYHMMRHRGEKPHVCPMCSKGFRVPSHLKMHMQQHLNERFTCQFCRKVFSQSRYLSRHLRTHTKGKAVKGTERIVPAASTATVSGPDTMGTVVVYENPSQASQPIKTEQQVIVDSVGDHHVVVQESIGDGGESVIQFVMQGKEGGEGGGERDVAVVDGEGDAVVVRGDPDNFTNTVQVSTTSEGSPATTTEEQAYVNADEGTRVVVGAFSEGEGGSMEDGSVTLPFRDLTQLLGGKHYRCDVCSHSFGVRPDSMYNMIHTGHSHILVINLNDHQSASSSSPPHHAQPDT